jgi:hypothetical protein
MLECGCYLDVEDLIHVPSTAEYRDMDFSASIQRREGQVGHSDEVIKIH